MRSRDIFKQLVPGIIASLVLALVINILVGVDTVNPGVNMLVIVLSCTIPVTFSGLIVLTGAAKSLDRTLSISEAFKRNLVFIALGTVIGSFYMVGMVNSGVDLTQVNELTHTITNSLLGIVVSTLLGYFSIKEYAEDVKYTRKNKKKK